MRRLFLLVVACALLLPATASAKVPAGWVGVLVDGPLFDGGVDSAAEFGVMRTAGVQGTRAAFYWSDAQPYATAAEVPPEQAASFADVGGVPTSWGRTDLVVGGLAARGLPVLPVVVRAPAWARRQPGVEGSSPSAAGRAAYARFMTALVGRYGPAGSFWAEHPEIRALPIRRWQVWNEPDGKRDWAEQPGSADYVQLLKPAAAAIRTADPGAKVVLAGLVGASWKDLGAIYKAGGRSSFDEVAIHPFTQEIDGVELILRRVRRAMAKARDAAKPLIVSEFSWPSAKGKTTQRYGFEVDEKGQARLVREELERLAKLRVALKIRAVFYATWISYDRSPDYPFDYSGLRTVRDGVGVAKPAFSAFRATVKRLQR